MIEIRSRKTIEVPQESVNRGIANIIANYFKFSSSLELTYDLLCPILISVALFGTLSFLINKNAELIQLINHVNGTSLSILAILAGFNAASLAIIASTDKKTLMKLFREKPEGDLKENILKILCNFFSYAIIIQLVSLVIGALVDVLFRKDIYINLYWVDHTFGRVILMIFGMLWMSLFLHSLFISIRNAALLHQYINFLGQDSSNDDDNDND